MAKCLCRNLRDRHAVAGFPSPAFIASDCGLPAKKPALRRIEISRQTARGCDRMISCEKQTNVWSPAFRRKLDDKPGRLKGVCRKNEFLCANSVMLCVSVAKFQEKHSPQRHGAYTENHGGLFPTDS